MSFELANLPWAIPALAVVLTLVFALGTALSVSSSIHLGMAHAASEGIPNLLPHATAFGALFWGAASDFFRVRFLITAASLMAAVALGLFWLLTEQPGMGGVVAVGLALGATHSLVWVLLADHVGVRFFATVAVAVSFVGSLLGSLSVPLVLNSVGFEAGVPVMAALALTLAIAAFIAPRLNLTVLDQEAI